jgi:DNA-binding CsgD family transcriptional regulator
MTNDAIGERLGITGGQVNQHAIRIYAEHRVSGKKELAKKLGREMPERWKTKKEAVAELLALGMTSHEIAARLGMKRVQVDIRIWLICKMNGVRSRFDLGKKMGWPIRRAEKARPRFLEAKYLFGWD